MADGHDGHHWTSLLALHGANGTRIAFCNLRQMSSHLILALSLCVGHSESDVAM